MSQKLTPERFKSAEFIRQIHSATAPDGTALEEIFDPAYWAHVSAKMHPRDRIEVWAEDGSWYADLMVISCSRTHAQVVGLLEKEFKATATPEENDPYLVAFKGPIKKWSIIRKNDKEVIKNGFEDKNAANTWLSSYLQTQMV